MEANPQKRVVVIGLDGASWNIIMQLIQERKLPTLEKIRRRGTFGHLESVIPPTSVPAWKCYSTGKSPGRLEVYDFLTLDIEKKKYRVVDSSMFKDKDVWDYLGELGYVACIYKMLGTHPAKETNGCMVTDLPNEKGFFPSSLKQEVEELFGSLYTDFNYTSDRENTYCKALREIEKDFAALKYLIDRFNPEFTHFTLSQTDHIQHFFWNDMTSDDPKYGKSIERAWAKVDEQLYDLLVFLKKKWGNDFYILIMSDHGFTGQKYIFNIGNWLLKEGYLKLTSRGKIFRALVFLKNISMLLWLLDFSQRFLRKFTGKGEKLGVQLMHIVDRLYEEFIDWEKSAIIPLTGCCLYINDKAFVSSSKEMLRVKLIEKISSIRDPENEPMAQMVLDGKAYHSVDSAPDVVIKQKNVGLYNGIVTKTLWSKPLKNKWTGMHASHGILLVLGPGIKKGYEIEGARILDLAPTILHIFGLPIPTDMDGLVLQDIFRKNSDLARRPIIRSRGETEKQRIKLKIKRLKSRRRGIGA